MWQVRVSIWRVAIIQSHVRAEDFWQNDPLSHGATVGRSVLACQVTDPIWRNATRGCRVIVCPPRMRTVNSPPRIPLFEAGMGGGTLHAWTRFIDLKIQI